MSVYMNLLRENTLLPQNQRQKKKEEKRNKSKHRNQNNEHQLQHYWSTVKINK